MSIEALRDALQPYRMPLADDLDAIPADPLNAITPEKVALGRLLFRDPTLLSRPSRPEGFGTSSCASCHHAGAGFQAGLRQGLGEGGSGAGEGRDVRAHYDASSADVQPRRSPSAMNLAWQPNLLWNGQFGATAANEETEYAWTEGTPKAANHLGYEGLEIQAIAGLEVHRMTIEGSPVTESEAYYALFVDAFPNAPWAEAIVTTERAGLAIAAYERTLLANRAPFQRWLAGEDAAMSALELEGARLFFGEAGCAGCHSDPGLGAGSFHAIGMGDLRGDAILDAQPDRAPDRGRADFTGRAEDEYAFKVPQLYNLLDSPFYGHGATFESVRDVIAYKNAALPEAAHLTLEQLDAAFAPLGLSEAEIDALTAFIEGALYDPALARYIPSPEELPNGTCSTFADPEAAGEFACVAPAPRALELDGYAIGGSDRWGRPRSLELPAGITLSPGRHARDRARGRSRRVRAGVGGVAPGGRAFREPQRSARRSLRGQWRAIVLDRRPARPHDRRPDAATRRGPLRRAPKRRGVGRIEAADRLDAGIV